MRFPFLPAREVSRIWHLSERLRGLKAAAAPCVDFGVPPSTRAASPAHGSALRSVDPSGNLRRDGEPGELGPQRTGLAVPGVCLAPAWFILG